MQYESYAKNLVEIKRTDGFHIDQISDNEIIHNLLPFRNREVNFVLCREQFVYLQTRLEILLMA